MLKYLDQIGVAWSEFQTTLLKPRNQLIVEVRGIFFLHFFLLIRSMLYFLYIFGFFLSSSSEVVFIYGVSWMTSMFEKYITSALSELKVSSNVVDLHDPLSMRGLYFQLHFLLLRFVMAGYLAQYFNWILPYIQLMRLFFCFLSLRWLFCFFSGFVLMGDRLDEEFLGL